MDGIDLPEAKKRGIQVSYTPDAPAPAVAELTIGLIIEDKNNILTEKTLSDTFAYKNLDNKFDLSQYENQIENNLLNKITQELIFYLNF